MPKKQYLPNAKERILKTAADIFATKGFDGARMDQIAKAANVPKSLIYYHFKSKDMILETLIENCMAQYRTILNAVSVESNAENPIALVEKIRTVYWQFLEENEDVIRIISMESLKKGSPQAGIAFKFAELIIKIEKEYLEKTGKMSDEDFQKAVVAEFFTSQIPVVLFFCLREAWSASFEIDPNRLTQYFLNSYDATYGAFKRKHFS